MLYRKMTIVVTAVVEVTAEKIVVLTRIGTVMYQMMMMMMMMMPMIAITTTVMTMMMNTMIRYICSIHVIL
jgi:hypothetical protein